MSNDNMGVGGSWEGLQNLITPPLYKSLKAVSALKLLKSFKTKKTKSETLHVFSTNAISALKFS